MAKPTMLLVAQNSAAVWFVIIFVFLFGYVLARLFSFREANPKRPP